jgi:hypothetical protein
MHNVVNQRMNGVGAQPYQDATPAVTQCRVAALAGVSGGKGYLV